MKTFLRIRKGKQTEMEKLKKTLDEQYLWFSGNRMQPYVLESLAMRLYELGWRKTAGIDP